MSISAYLELDSGEIMDEIKDTDIFQDIVREVAVEAAKEYFDSFEAGVNLLNERIDGLREEFEAKHERLFSQLDARIDDNDVDFHTEIRRLNERIDGLRAAWKLREKDTEEDTTEKHEFSGAGVGLIIRFATEEDLEKFVRGQLTDLFEPVLPLRTRHADSSDPKELFVLNRGGDGR